MRRIRVLEIFMTTNNKHSLRSMAWKKANRDKVKLQNQRRYIKHKDRMLAYSKAWNINVGKFRRYNLTKEEYGKLFNEQKGCCAICEKPQSELTGRIKHLGIDHNHQTGKVRGLLCDVCNRGIGYLRDDIVLITKALNYLKKYDK